MHSMTLWNDTDGRVLRERMQRDDEPRTTISFYRYARIRDPRFFRDHLYLTLNALGVLGRIYVATEGINAQISVPAKHFDALRQALDDIVFLRGVRLNIAVDDDGKSFFKLAIKVRPKILADGLNDETFDVTDRGTHLDAVRFNEFLEREDSIVIDMRNHYEHEVGHFEGAVLPDVDNFRESLPLIEEEVLQGNEDKHILMYCTGGIRCEKASAWFKHRGYTNVYQLDGGIIQYAREAREKGLDVRFRGKNFVFDERLGERITDDVLAHCHQCGAPCDDHTNCRNQACNLLFIQCTDCAEQHDGCCSEACTEIAALPEEEQRVHRQRAGERVHRNVFRKGRGLKTIGQNAGQAGTSSSH